MPRLRLRPDLRRNPKTRPSAVVLFSGGLDSAVTLEWALRQGWQCWPLCLEYGQSNVKEIAAASRQLRSYFIPKYRWCNQLKLCRVELGALSNSVMLGGRGDFAKGADISIPARNIVFMGLAATYAVTKGALYICTGIQNDYMTPDPAQPSYGDTTRAFAEDMEVVLRSYSDPVKQGLFVRAPLVDMPKSGIIHRAKKWGIPVAETWSCLQGQAEPCGICKTCAQIQLTKEC